MNSPIPCDLIECSDMDADDKVRCPIQAFKCCLGDKKILSYKCNDTLHTCVPTFDGSGQTYSDCNSSCSPSKFDMNLGSPPPSSKGGLYNCIDNAYSNFLDHTVNVCVDAANQKTINTLQPLIHTLIIICSILLGLIAILVIANLGSVFGVFKLYKTNTNTVHG